MRLLLLTLIPVSMLFSCSENKPKTPVRLPEKKNNKPMDTVLSVDSPEQTILHAWLLQATGQKIHIDSASIKNSKIDLAFYKTSGVPASGQYDSYFKLNNPKAEISVTDSFIIIDVSDDLNTTKFFLGNRLFIRTYHLGAGDNGGTTIYNLKTRKNEDFDFTMYTLKNNLGTIERDGYGFDEAGEPTGHWWETGTFNTSTGEMKWESREK